MRPIDSFGTGFGVLLLSLVLAASGRVVAADAVEGQPAGHPVIVTASASATAIVCVAKAKVAEPAPSPSTAASLTPTLRLEGKQLRGTGTPGAVYVLQSASAVIGPWENRVVLTNTTGAVSYTDPQPAASGQKFYRIAVRPE